MKYPFLKNSLLPSVYSFLLIAGLVASTVSASFASKESKNPDASVSSISGNIWVETDGNATFNGEDGPSGVLIILYDIDTDTIVEGTFSSNGKFEFNDINPGKYYISVDQAAFLPGNVLFSHQSCLGVNDADDMVDNDDNGTDTSPNSVNSSSFNLNDNITIEFIDFCFTYICEDQFGLTAPSCDELSAMDVLCEISGLNGYCNTLPQDSSEGIQPVPLCNGFTLSENISWLSFIASEGVYSMVITPFDCTPGNIGQQGIQVGIYEDCTFEEEAFCSNLCTTDPIVVSSAFLKPGQVYYMYINGCDGDQCSYRIDINGNAFEPSLDPSDVCVFSAGSVQCADIDYCPNSDVTFIGQGLNFTGDFTWSITTISGEVYNGDSIQMTNSSLLTIPFSTEGKYNICLTDVSNGCVDQAWTGEVCREITISSLVDMPMNEDFGEFFVCGEDVSEFSVSALANLDPNGDGDPGWNAPTSEFTLGLNQATVFTAGCSYEQQFTLSAYPPSPIEDVLITVCEDDLPLNYDVLTFFHFFIRWSKYNRIE